ncbi:uncharacterized protein CANTADRAFT_4764 [Suhomyces tanzawaensis NRRL Y-17324]|uniref:Uncharacterized protein n=1 Tax=Suhomyces tanzawaensis NRRL Y-17324 TaxID=984487 RepID=A0A1E4SMP5_9ASCO|nr:uncharacterized protein CANTADRAFT_4764 [Suhomyces tanzawaensis NRRL Y-17324]ODV80758.1 hypothetical protein CANTADRAFT_4764 [Suhomyces tanzawaensis NRRL Y-17324]
MSVSNRVALAPIKDSCLNKPGSRDGTPMRKPKRVSPLASSHGVNSFANSPTTTSSIISARTPGYLVGTAGVSTSFNGASGARHTPIKSLSFSESRSSSLSPTIRGAKNDTAGLAATKLKLKLQLALYKLQQQSGGISGNNNNNSQGVSSSAHPPKTSPTTTATTSPIASLNISSLKRPASSPYLPTPPRSRPYSSSVNINLKTKAKLLSKTRTFPSLSNIATSDHAAKVQKLRLFKIKRKSIFYSAAPANKPLPLSINHVNLPKPMLTSLANSIRQAEIPAKIDPDELPRLSRADSDSLAKTNLPSINKILKTPIKNASSTRHLISSLNVSSAVVATDDTTIDEDNDATICNTTIKEKERKGSCILTSSPIASFGTPNSFSVAKSLLQLGGYYESNDPACDR